MKLITLLNTTFRKWTISLIWVTLMWLIVQLIHHSTVKIMFVLLVMIVLYQFSILKKELVCMFNHYQWRILRLWKTMFKLEVQLLQLFKIKLMFWQNVEWNSISVPQINHIFLRINVLRVLNPVSILIWQLNFVGHVSLDKNVYLFDWFTYNFLCIFHLFFNYWKKK